MVTPSQQWKYSRLSGTADSADFQGSTARPVSEDFRHFFTQIVTEYDADPITTVAEHILTTRRYRFSGSDRQTRFTIFAIFSLKSPPFALATPPPQRPTPRPSATLFRPPIFRVRSPDPFLTIFAIFSLKSPPNAMATPSQQRRTTRDSAVLPIRPIFRVRSPDPFLTIFAIFSLKSPPNLHTGQGIHLMRVQRAFALVSKCFYSGHSPENSESIGATPSSIS